MMKSVSRSSWIKPNKMKHATAPDGCLVSRFEDTARIFRVTVKTTQLGRTRLTEREVFLSWLKNPSSRHSINNVAWGWNSDTTTDIQLKIITIQQISWVVMPLQLPDTA